MTSHCAKSKRHQYRNFYAYTKIFLTQVCDLSSGYRNHILKKCFLQLYSEMFWALGILNETISLDPWFTSNRLGIREKITSLFIALRFRSYLVDLIELNRRRSLSYTEDSVSEARANMA